MPLREAFYLGAVYQIGAAVRLSGPADKSAALFGASRLDPFGALRPRINRAEATSRLTAQPGACARRTGDTEATGRPKSEFRRCGGGRCARKGPPGRLRGPWSDFLVQVEASPIRRLLSCVIRALVRSHFFMTAAEASGVMKNSHQPAAGEPLPPVHLASCCSIHQVMKNSHQMLPTRWPCHRRRPRRVMKNSQRSVAHVGGRDGRPHEPASGRPLRAARGAKCTA